MIARFRGASFLLLGLFAWWSQAPPASKQAPGAKIWVDRYQEIEEYLRTAECVSMEIFGPNRAARCTLRPGGPVARMAWRSLPPGLYRGFWESYKGEIAAYQVDRLLKMDMIPPTVERHVQGTSGSAQLWVENVLPVKADDSPGESNRIEWENQTRQMSMFDNLIGNRGRNHGNMLRDASWHLVLIDHSRAFGPGPELPHKMSRIDEAFWTRIESLTRSQLDAAVGAWLDEKQIAAILDRRTSMRAEINRLPK